MTRPSEYVQLTDFADSATAPALSTDGRMVAFIRGGEFFLSTGQIYVKLLPNGDAVQLTDDQAPKLGPVFTPDGSRVAYTLIDRAREPFSWDTWTVPVQGGRPSRLLPNAAGLVWVDAEHVLFSEIKPPGIHMGIVTSTEARAEHREVYFPAHERAMAHYSWASPDRRWVLLVEMDRTAAWQPCRLVPFDGSSPGRQVGPVGACIAAAWSPDGRWMYFNARVGGSFHLWRQRFPDGSPEQITFGPTEEEGLAVAPDGRSLVTSIGVRRSSVWLHDDRGERALTAEGFAFDPQFSRDGHRVYYLAWQATAEYAEMWMVDLTSARRDRVLPGMAVEDFEVSPDETEVAFTRRLPGGQSEVWLASLDRRSAPRRVMSAADQVSFGANGQLIVRALGDRSNSLMRVAKDGADRRQIARVIVEKQRTSPDGTFAIVGVPARGEGGGGADRGHAPGRRRASHDLRSAVCPRMVARRTVLPDHRRGRHGHVRVVGARAHGRTSPCPRAVSYRCCRPVASCSTRDGPDLPGRASSTAPTWSSGRTRPRTSSSGRICSGTSFEFPCTERGVEYGRDVRDRGVVPQPRSVSRERCPIHRAGWRRAACS